MGYDRSRKNGEAKGKENSLAKDEQIIQREEIKGTPFTAIKANGEWFLTMGKYRLSEPKKTLKAVTEDAHRADWFRVMSIVQIMIDENKNTWKEKLVKETVEDHTGPKENDIVLTTKPN